MSVQTADAELSLRQSVIRQQCVTLRLPTLASQCGPLAEQAERERRAIDRRIKEAHLPHVKTLDEFDFRQAPLVSPTRMSELAEVATSNAPSRSSSLAILERAKLT
jgi:DNA replication protein DnaC